MQHRVHVAALGSVGRAQLDLCPNVDTEGYAEGAGEASRAADRRNLVAGQITGRRLESEDEESKLSRHKYRSRQCRPNAAVDKKIQRENGLSEMMKEKAYEWHTSPISLTIG